MLFKILFFEAENGIFLLLFMGLKPLPLVLAYFDAFGIFKSHYDLEKSMSKKYMLKYIKVYNPALVLGLALTSYSPLRSLVLQSLRR